MRRLTFSRLMLYTQPKAVYEYLSNCYEDLADPEALELRYFGISRVFIYICFVQLFT
jgi:hypothetical protein